MKLSCNFGLILGNGEKDTIEADETSINKYLHVIMPRYARWGILLDYH